MVENCPKCGLKLFTTTKDYEVKIQGIAIGLLPVITSKCDSCGKDYVFIKVRVGENTLEIIAEEHHNGKVQ